MSLLLDACPRSIALLQEFAPAGAELEPSQMVAVTPDRIPEPERSLLVHEHDMTSTLTRFFGDELRLDVLECRLHHDRLERHIVLRTVSDHRPVEYGAIRIRLGGLDEAVRAKIVECVVPLGAILNDHKVGFRSCPGGFFTIRATDLMVDLLGLAEPVWLYGRCNCLSAADGNNIAEVVEILPPLNTENRRVNLRCKTMRRS
ncbi:MAG: hypothetical protein ACYC6Y_04130 [Thermoguttaceae bacterium]